MTLQRLDAEALRDSLIHVAGQLNEENRGGKPDGVNARKDGLITVPSGTNGWRRSVYVLQRRTQIPTLLTTFDLPRMEPNCVKRPESTVAPQALHLLNDGTVNQLAGYFAKRLIEESKDTSAQLTHAYWLALSRAPTNEELKLDRSTLEQLNAQWKKELGDKGAVEAIHEKALTNYCRALLNSSEFQYVD